MEATHVRDWMTMTPFTVTPDTMLVDAYQLMRSYDIRRLPVLEDDLLVGIVTLGDIRTVVANGVLDLLAFNEVLAHTPIKRVMTRSPITVRPEDISYTVTSCAFWNVWKRKVSKALSSAL